MTFHSNSSIHQNRLQITVNKNITSLKNQEN